MATMGIFMEGHRNVAASSSYWKVRTSRQSDPLRYWVPRQSRSIQACDTNCVNGAGFPKQGATEVYNACVAAQCNHICTD